MTRARIQVEKITAALSDCHVVGVWVFGSSKNGQVRDDGDLDIAVLFEREPDLDELVVCRARLQQALGFDDIDLVSLNSASAILRFEALCGQRVLCANEGRCAEFASLTAREYEDEMAMCQRWL